MLMRILASRPETILQGRDRTDFQDKQSLSTTMNNLQKLNLNHLLVVIFLTCKVYAAVSSSCYSFKQITSHYQLVRYKIRRGRMPEKCKTQQVGMVHLRRPVFST